MLKHKDLQNEKDIKALVKNYNLLRIVEKIESRKSQINTQQSYVSEKKCKQVEMDIKSQLSSERITRIEKSNVCKQHNLPTIYYNTNNNSLLCDSCVKGTNINYAPIPKV